MWITIFDKVLTLGCQILSVIIILGLVLICWSTWAGVNPLLEDGGGSSGEPASGDLYYRAPTPVGTPKPAYPTEDEGLPMCRRFCTALEATKLHWHGNPMICECYYEFQGTWAWRIVWMDRTEADYNEPVNP